MQFCRNSVKGVFRQAGLQVTTDKVLPSPTDCRKQPSAISGIVTRQEMEGGSSLLFAVVPQITGCTITEKAPTRAFSWLKAATNAFTFKTLLRHYAKWELTPRSLIVKLGPRRKGHKGQAGWLA